VTLVALTGATGFIGRHLLATLPGRGCRVRVLLRRPTDLPPEASGAVVGDLLAPRNMAQALRDVDAVIHSAGIAHSPSGMPADDFRAINTEATVALARAAERAGVRRFVFLSSVRAQAGPSAPGILTEEAEPRPTDLYGRSKLDAERASRP
jgi:UDP-glucose 4-epimerase